MQTIIQRVLILIAISTSMSACAQYKDFDEMATKMAEGDVPTIKTQEVSKALDEGEELILLDAREKEEYTISHIKDARYVGYDFFNKSKIKDIDKDKKIVVYCSVGYRSCKIGEKLKAMGYSNVYNMYGGIFDWVNQGYPVVDKKDQSTDKIHSYNEDWGQWLLKGVKVH